MLVDYHCSLCSYLICLFQSLTVFYMSIATVKGPTPPGTGVANWHFSLDDFRMSPQSFRFSSRFIPISIAIDPYLSYVIKFGFPTAAITISAYLVKTFKFWVWLWQRVIVAFLFSKTWKRGSPTKELLPAITTFLPSTSTLYSSNIFITPWGVQGNKSGVTCSIILDRLAKVRQSTSFIGSMF